MKLDDNIKYIEKMLKRRNGDRFKLIYRFTTENIGGYIDKFNLNNKSLLTVGSSADQVINANMYGCNYVTVVDINPNSEHYTNLKIAALICLSYQDFLNFFTIKRDDYFMPRNIYVNLRDCLRNISIESLIIWDYIYDVRNKYSIDNMFHYHLGELSNISKFNPYLYNEENYNLVKDRIENLKIKFMNANILNPDKIFDIERFDNINLSNIYCYNNGMFKIKNFKNAVNKLVEYLNDDGKILIAYLYGTSDNISLVDFASGDIIEDISFHHIKGIRGIYNGDSTCDTVAIYEKKRLTK